MYSWVLGAFFQDPQAGVGVTSVGIMTKTVAKTVCQMLPVPYWYLCLYFHLNVRTSTEFFLSNIPL